MKKAAPRFLMLLIAFFGGWLLLSSIDFMGIFNIRHKIDYSEKKTGDFFMNSIRQQNEEILDPKSAETLQKVKAALCIPNHIDTGAIHLHLIMNNEVNAFALPGGHIVIYTGLVDFCNNEEELCGVLSHEMAHIEHRHVARKMTKEMTLMLLEASSGNAGGEALKTLTSKAYDRRLESDADLTAVNYMQNAKLDPRALADILHRMGEKYAGMPKSLYWLSDHDEADERARMIDDASSTVDNPAKVLSAQEWEVLKAVSREE